MTTKDQVNDRHLSPGILCAYYASCSRRFPHKYAKVIQSLIDEVVPGTLDSLVENIDPKTIELICKIEPPKDLLEVVPRFLEQYREYMKSQFMDDINEELGISSES